MESRSSNSAYSVFQQVAACFGDKTAIEYGDTRLSYADLDRMATAIASRLTSQAPASPSRVALLFDDRVRAIAAMLGVLRAGHAFVPLDPADPEQRIRLIMQDSMPSVLLSDTEHLTRAIRLVADDCRHINVEDIYSAGVEASLIDVSPHDLAYISYTSGSSGRPKGVCQTHRNLLYFIGCYTANLRLCERDRMSLLYSLSFSAANMDIFGGLLNGATVCAYDMRRHGVPLLAGWLAEQQISVLHAVPTVFRKLADGLQTGEVLRQIRAVDLAGEAVTPHDVELFRRHFPPDCQFINRLAATEAGEIAHYEVDSGWHAQEGILPVGVSPEEMEIRIEHPDGGSAGTNETGRIVIAGPYLSPGYWQQPELNRAVFAEDPGRAGWRIFRTEDIGRIGPDNLLYFVGRAGTRVKIRGQSVDLNEVEAALRMCSGVADAAVVAGNRNSDQEAELLIAHVVMAQSAGRDAKRLRHELAERLPGYMIPSAFAFPESLPLTSSGKIDRGSLQTQPLAQVESQDDPASGAPDEIEKLVAQIFEQILKRKPGHADDFFMLGGDSMLAVELQMRLSSALGREVPHKVIFGNATVSGIAESLRNPGTADDFPLSHLPGDVAGQPH